MTQANTPSEQSVTVSDYSPAVRTMREEVLHGLSHAPKMLPSQYLYDERGAVLFEKICETPEYYPTRTEIAILRERIDEIVERLGPRVLVIEPGSGSGIKTRLLLEHLDQPAGYVPIDIAGEQLEAVANELNATFPDLAVLPVCADFTAEYELPACPKPIDRQVVYMPGSTIGNFTPPRAVKLLERMRSLVGPGGGILIGVDLKKDPAIVEPAYDDAAGVSAAFATNYLERLNRDLDADFDLGRFEYEAPYNPELGRIEMGLTSQRAQVVQIAGQAVRFERGERVLTELSHKYTLAEFAKLAARAGLSVEDVWLDPDGLFSVQYLIIQGR